MNFPQGQSRQFFSRFMAEPLIIAHRGYRACFPENTLCAFEQCLGKSRMIELDVRLCQGGIPVVYHDSTLKRTSNAATLAAALGMTSLEVADWQLHQLRLLDIGSWFLARDPFSALRNGLVDREFVASLMPQRILTLGEALSWATRNGMPLNIEIKDMRGTPFDGMIVPAVIREVDAAEAADLVLISSFNHAYLQTCRQLAPELATAALQQKNHPPDLIYSLKTLGVSAYHPEDAIVDAALIKTVRSASLHINVFTVNDARRQQQLFDFGVTGIFSDFPEPAYKM